MWKLAILFVAIPLLISAQSRDTDQEVEEMSYKDLESSMDNFEVGEGDCEKQIAMAKRRYKIYFQNFPLEHAQFYKTVMKYSSAHFFCGDIITAKSFLLENIERLDKEIGITHRHTINLLSYLNDLYRKSGDFQNGLLTAKEIKSRTKTIPKLNRYDYEASISLMKIYYQMGLYELALSHMPKKILGPEFYKIKVINKYVQKIKFFANLYREIGQYEKAYPLYIAGLNSAKKGENKGIGQGQLQLDLGIFFNRSGQYEKAIAILQETAQIFKQKVGENSGWYGRTMNALGASYQAIEDYENAILCYEKAYENYALDYGREHPYCSNFLNDIATAYFHLADYEKALSLYHQAIALAEKTLGKNHPEYAEKLNNLATLHFEQNAFDKALPLYLEANNIAKKALGKINPDIGKYAFNLASNYEALDQLDDSRVAFINGNNNAVLRLEEQFDHFSEQEQTALLKTFQHQFDQFQSFSLRNDARLSFAENCYNDVLVYKGLLLKDRKRLLEAVRNNPDSKIREQFQEWETAKKQLARQYSMSSEKRSPDFANLEQRANSLESALTRASQQFKDSRTSVNWKSVQAQLKEGEATIEFAHYQYFPKGERNPSDSIVYVAYLIKRDFEKPEQIFLFEEKDLGSLRATLRLYNFQKRGTRPNLNELIWQPLQDWLNDIHTIHFAPSGLLHYLNIGAIPISETATISDKYTLHTLGSTRELLYQKGESAISPKNATLFGGIQYQSEQNSTLITKAEKEEDEMLFASNTLGDAYRDYRGKEWTYLHWTEKEVENLEAHFLANGVEPQLLKEFEATENAFKKIGIKAPSPQVLHLATHGYFFPDPEIKRRKATQSESVSVFQDSKHPMIRSGLILAGANRAWKGGVNPPGQEDGILTAYEIAQMDLSNTELVVLSACNTGLGDIKGHEGVYGLQRAFKMAGAKYLLMSLWSVPDKQTHEFMNLFYDAWLNGEKTIPEAYQNAQNEMRKRYSEPFDPSSWAGFILLE